jgi:hypothetical protein
MYTNTKQKETIMDFETLKALKESIKHWQENVKLAKEGEKIIRTGPGVCSLCIKFNISGSRCEGCPIRKKTKKLYCGGTPYYEVIRHKFDSAEKQLLIKSCRKEVAFLRSLLPKSRKV